MASILWADSPSEEESSRFLSIQRIDKTTAFSWKGIILGDRPLGAYVHWTGRTVPCMQPTCECCERKMPRRWTGYLHAWSTRRMQSVLLELTPGIMPRVNTHLAEHGTLRYWVLTISRKPAKATGQLIIEAIEKWQATEEQISKAPPAADVQRELARLWRMSHLVAKDEPAATIKRFANSALKARDNGHYNPSQADPG